MNEKVLIVEDQFTEADNLRLMLIKAGCRVLGIARSVIQAQALIEKERPDIVMLDVFLKGKLTGIDLGKQLKESNIAFVYLSANSNEEVLAAAKATQPYGFLLKPFREKDLMATLEVVRYRYGHSLKSQLMKEALLQEQLSGIVNGAGSSDQKILAIGRMLQPYIPFDYMSTQFVSGDKGADYATGFLRVGFDEYQTINIRELLMMTGIAMPELMNLFRSVNGREGLVYHNGDAFSKITKERSLRKLIADTFHMQSYLTVPLQLPDGQAFRFCFYSRRMDAYLPEHQALIGRLEDKWARSIENMLMPGKLHSAMFPASYSSAALQGDDAEVFFEGIIGKSHLLLNVFDHISIVAPSDTSVLIMGESGTGKERVADCIHQLSSRKMHPFIKVNCAALPPTLIESELFGHEKGSFTGAIDKRIGKFEQADNGTIFLDEIGDMPMELQARMLRVLQEKEIERIGSGSHTKVNVRVIAATNRNLEKEVAEGRFRLDLYYRLNVFPILMPALRERKEDIPALASHFIQYYNRKNGKKIMGLPDKILKKLTGYTWPGNIRELEHLIERSVLLAKGTMIEDIQLPSVHQKEQPGGSGEVRMKTIKENERDHIMAVLKKCNGKIWGAGAAAEVLDVPPSTLRSKMKKLGIRKEYTE